MIGTIGTNISCAINQAASPADSQAIRHTANHADDHFPEAVFDFDRENHYILLYRNSREEVRIDGNSHYIIYTKYEAQA